MSNPISIYHCDNLKLLGSLGDGSINVIYVDPPFNTKMTRKLNSQKTVFGEDGQKTLTHLGERKYEDTFSDFKKFLYPRLVEAHRVLAEDGTIFLHLDYREVHYAKIWMDEIFGRENFINEIIWAYDYGGKSKTRFSPKHDNILMYSKNHREYYFDVDKVERIPYMAPGLVGEEKAKRGKLVTDTWFHTIVPTNGKERTGYPTQKPRGVVRRALAPVVRDGDTVLDFFAGSGTTGEVAVSLGASAILCDTNQQAIDTMLERFDIGEISVLV